MRPRASFVLPLIFATAFSFNLSAAEEIDEDIVVQEVEESQTPISQESEPETPSIPPEEITPPPPPSERPAPKLKEASFAAFTGKITKNKVRMRAQANLESKIVRELSKDEMVIITGETEDFYEVKPPVGCKAYVYRTYILDNTVEGNHVNVRLDPDTDSTVIAQLNNGEKVNGTISPIHSKWMEIAVPDSVRFFICKEYVEKIGDPDVMAKIESRRNQVNQLLEATYALSRLEMQKPFNEINLDDLYGNLNTIINEYSDFHEQVGRAKALQQSLQEQYLQSKISYLETKAQTSSIKPENELVAIATTANQENTLDPRLSQWLPVEHEIFTKWAKENFDKSLTDFYEKQKQDATTLSGIIQPYNRPVRNKPGDYVLLHRVTRLPVAFLYSTVVDLHNYEDQEITLKGATRPNNNFAFPAYFVVSVE